MVLCGDQHSYLPLSRMKELLKDAVQSLAFNAWVDFANRRGFSSHILANVSLAPPAGQPHEFPAPSVRETSDGEEGAAGLSTAGTGFPSPTAQAMPAHEQALLLLCSSQYSHLSLSVMKELLKDSVQLVAFNLWVDPTGHRSRRTRRVHFGRRISNWRPSWVASN